MKKLSKAALMGGVAAAAVAATVGVAAPASASSDSFLRALTVNGWHDSYRGSLLNTGYEVCRELGQGYSYSSAVSGVYYNTNTYTSWSDASWFVNLAESHLCQ